MEEKKQTIDELIEQFCGYLLVNGRCETTIKRYHDQLQQIRDYMLSNNLLYYNKSVEQGYIEHVLGDCDYYHLKIKQRNFIDEVAFFHEFQQTGTTIAGLHKGPPKVFNGVIGQSMERYLADRHATLNLSKVSADHDRLSLFKFYRFLTNKGVKTPDQITEVAIFSFICQLDANFKSARYFTGLAVKR